MERLSVNRHSSYLGSLRDQYVDRTGVVITAQVPLVENVYDEFGDLNSTYDTTTLTIHGIPRYDQYYQLISVLGESIEDDLPLDVIIRTDVHLKKDTILCIPRPQMNSSSTVDTYWRVLSTENKHIETYVANVAKCVPARQDDWVASV